MTTVLKICRTISSLIKVLNIYKKPGKTIGFVPTMGAIHKGHISLIHQSTKKHNYTVCSIYINPKQFNNKIDFINYPKQEESDINKLKQTKCNIVFIPSSQEMYPDHDDDRYDVDKREEEGIENFTKSHNVFSQLEGKKRPGHLVGMMIIVHKLFQLVEPNTAYFGEKDYQQLWIIRLYKKTFPDSPTITGVDTVRENNGLALSSRNKHLNSNQIKVATKLFKALNEFVKKINIYFTHSKDTQIAKKIIDHIKEEVLKNILKNPLIKLDYFELINVENFNFVEKIDCNKKYRVLIAAYVGEIRLIDNTGLELC